MSICSIHRTYLDKEDGLEDDEHDGYRLFQYKDASLLTTVALRKIRKGRTSE